MLVDKTSKKKTKKDAASNKDNIESMRSWVRKIEQTTNSVSSRLSAVEKRLSGKKTDSSDNQPLENVGEGPISRAINKLKETKKDKNITEISKVIDQEFTQIQGEIISNEDEINSIQGQLDTINTYLGEIKEEIKKLQETETNTNIEFKTRIEKIERKAPPVMKVGNMEIPIEITGIIGGILAFILAILIYFQLNEIILSPFFLIIIGIIFIVSAVLKTIHSKPSTPIVTPEPNAAEAEEG